MNGYTIVDASNRQYDGRGIRLANGKKCFFFKNKGSYIKEVIVAKKFDLPLKNGEIFLYLKDINDSKDIKNMIAAFASELYKVGIDVRKIIFRVIINNELEQKQMAQIVSSLGIQAQFVRSQNYVTKLENELMASGNSKEIKKEDNGISKHYVVNDGKVYDDNGSLSLSEQKKILLESWMKDPVMSTRISQLSKLELDDLVMQHVTSNKKEYYMEQSNDMVDNDKKSEMAKNEASLNDGRGNAELGIIENAPNSVNQYSTIEENNGKYRVVTPEVSSSVISSNKNGSIVSSSFTSNDSTVDSSMELSNKQEQLRGVVDVVYYVDNDSFKIYDDDGNEIGMVGRNGYLVDYTNNCLTKDGRGIGYVGDINNMSNAKDKNKTMVKTLRKEDRSAAFVSFSVILLVLSALFFGGAIILYFMT